MPRSDDPQILVCPEADERGIAHLQNGQTVRIGWDAFSGAVAAEIGEPQGVRTILFDLQLSADAGGGTLRLDADPGEQATAWAERIAAGLGEHAGPSIKSLALDGTPTRWFPDVASFEEAAGGDWPLG